METKEKVRRSAEAIDKLAELGHAPANWRSMISIASLDLYWNCVLDQVWPPGGFLHGLGLIQVHVPGIAGLGAFGTADGLHEAWVDYLEGCEAERHQSHATPVIGCTACEAIDPGTWRERYADYARKEQQW